MSTVIYKDLGLTDYGDCWAEQQRLFNSIIEAKHTAREDVGEDCGVQKENNYLILCEHPHTYTLGRFGNEQNMLLSQERLTEIGAVMIRSDRGGDITYHGPGQLVGYPIVDLERMGVGIREYISRLEQTVIDTLAELGIDAGRSEGAAGVWLAATPTQPLRKICAIGVKASHGVTMHGFALNVTTDLNYFRWINPCGFTDRGVTSIAEESDETITMERVKTIYGECFDRIMKYIK